MPLSQYAVVVSTPMGNMDGTIVFSIDGTTLSGRILFMDKDNTFTDGTIDESGNIAFQGEVFSPLGVMAYTMTGTVVDGKVDANAETKLGKLKVRSK